MMKIEDTEINRYGDNTRCGTCGDHGLVPCDHRGTGRDTDGWCTRCDYPADEPGVEILCPACQ